MSEQWKDVVGYEGRYQVSDLGRVRSIRGDKVGIIQPNTRRAKYPRVALAHAAGGKGVRLVSIHKIVLEAFVGPCPPGMECAHGDGNAWNPALSNLRWATPAENAADKVRHGRHISQFGRKLSEDDVRAIRASVLPIHRLMEIYGICKNSVSNIRSRKTWRNVA